MKTIAQNNMWDSANNNTLIFPNKLNNANVGIGTNTPLQRLHIHQKNANVCPPPFGGVNFGVQQSNVEAKKPPVNANAGAANGKPALQNAMAKYSNALQKLQQKAQNLQNAATTAAQQAQIAAMQTTLDSLTLEANGLDMAQSATGNAGGLALLNPALDSLQNAAAMLRAAIDNAAATINAAGGKGEPCNTPFLYETYAYFTTNATGEQLNKGVRVGIFDKIGMLNNYSGGWLMTAQADPASTAALSTARLSPPTTGDGYAGYFELGFPNAHTLRAGYRISNTKPVAYWNAPATLQLNPTSGQPVETGGSALIGADMVAKGAVVAGTGVGPGVKLWHEGPNGNARIDVLGNSGDIVFNYDSNRNVYIGSQNNGAPYANLTVAGEITALKGDLEAPNGSVNVKDNLAGTKLIAKYAQLGGNGSGADVVIAANGTVCAREVRVSDVDPCAVPDYVFDANYALPTLSELAAHISARHTLPGMPSDSELAAGGLNLAQFQLKLLEKLEEQALYILQLKKEIDEMKKGGK